MSVGRIFLLVLLHLPIASVGETTSTPDSALTTYAFQAPHYPIRIHYRSDLSTFLDEKVKGEWFEYEGFNTRLIKTRVSENDSLSYTVDFNAGASIDPSFEFYALLDQQLTKIGRVPGTELHVPGDGAFYVSGHTNSMFNMKRKFEIRENKIVEIAQPFYHVGVTSVTTQDVHIFSDTLETSAVAYLPKGTEVTVLLNRRDHYLVKAPYGLTGWLKITVPWEGPIKHISWAGD